MIDGLAPPSLVRRIGERARPVPLWQRALGRPVLAVFLVALSVRAVVAVAIWIGWDSVVFNDDGYYLSLIGERAAGDTAQWSDYDRTLFDSTAAFLHPLVLVRRYITASPLASQLIVAVLGATVAALTVHLLRRLGCHRSALLGGLAVALLPSQILFSSLVLKDALLWVGLAAAGIGVLLVGRREAGRSTWLGLGVLVVALVAMAFTREHTAIVASWAAAAGVVLVSMADRRWRAVAVLVVAVAVPWVADLGPGGVDFVRRSGSLEERRSANAENADTAIAPTRDEDALADPAAPAPSRPAPGASRSVDDSGGLEDLTYLPRGIVSVLFEPTPWRSGGFAVRLAQIENIVWYPLLLLALLGAYRLVRSGAGGIYCVLVGVGLTAVYGLTEGNFGTAFRHRGEIVWVVTVAACFGLAVVVEAWRAATGSDAQQP